MTDPEDLLGSEGADVDAWLDEAAAAPPGDFADVLRRAQQLPGSRVSAQDVEVAEQLPQDDEELRARLAFGTLDDFLDDASAWVSAQGHGEPPPMRATPETARPARRRGYVFAAVAAVAAAAAALWLARPVGIASREAEGTTPSAAANRSLTESAGTVVRPRTAPEPKEPEPEPEPEAAPEPEPEPEPEVEPEPDPTGGVDDSAPARPRRSVAELDALARAAWRAGDLGRARSLFERVVARAGRGESADIAYGDLFTLARRQGDTAGLRRYWRRYVKRFPSGRYIDDARAGLCRAARGERAQRCWEAYLEARPQGTFRADAEAAIREP